MNNVYAILGSDLAMIKKKANLLVLAVAGEDADQFTLDICETGDKVSAEVAISMAIESIQTPAFMGLVKTVWLKDFPFADEGPKTAKDPLNKKIRILASMIETGIAKDINLIITGAGTDSRKSFFKCCKKNITGGSLEVLNQPKVTDRGWQDQIRSLIILAAKEKELNLTRETIEYLINVFGVNTASIENELEKISCFCGEKDIIRCEDILDISHGDREAEYYAFGSALSNRNLNDAMYSLKRLFNHSKDDSVAIGILTQATNAFRQMLQVKLFMGITKATPHNVPNVIKSLSASQKERLMKSCASVLTGNPFMMKFKAIEANNYSGSELVKAIHLLTDACCKVVSSSIPKQLLLEHLALQIIQKNK